MKYWREKQNFVRLMDIKKYYNAPKLLLVA
jgi:hypothetical protein